MKRYLLTLAAAGLMSANLIAQEEKETNVHVIHFDGAELISMDTSFASNSGYTVNDYLNLHGIDPSDAQIFELNKDTDFHEFNAEDDVWMFRADNMHRVEIIQEDIQELPDGSDSKEVKIMHFIDDDGNEEQQIWIDGVEVEELPEGVKVFEFKGNADDLKHRVEIDGQKSGEAELMEVQVEVFIDENGEEHRTILVNGEEVDELPVGNVVGENIVIEIDSDELIEERIELIEQNVEVIKTIDEEGNEHVQYILNGQEVDELPELPELPEGENFEILKVIEIDDEHTAPGNMIFFGDGPSEKMTVVIVNETTRSAELPETNVNENVLEPQNLSFYPNPSEGRFRVEFILPEEGRTKVTLYDVSGKIVWEDDLGMFSGNYAEDVDVSDKGSGTYIMRITQDNKTMAEKVIIR